VVEQALDVDIRSWAENVRREVYDAASEWCSRDRLGRVAPFAVGAGQILAALDGLERRTRRSVWNMQPGLRYAPSASTAELDARSRRRGVEIRFLADGRSESVHPLLQSVEHGRARITAANIRVLVVDEEIVVCEGPHTRSGDVTAWQVHDPDLRERVLDLWRVCWNTARPAALPIGADRLLDDRELEVARLMCLGHTDKHIARELELSTRSIQRDVGSVLAHVGAQSRSEAVARILGVTEE
jgi:DNA-binding CsgD family transcriptional regulator